MSKIKKIVLSLGAILTVAVASVIGFAYFAPKTSIRGGGTNNGVSEVVDNLDNEVIHKAGSVSFQSGSNTLNYSYTPNENAKSTSTIAYEYCFGSTMDTTMAVNLKSIDTTNVTVRYAYSPTKLTSSDTFTSDEEYTIQKLTSRGSKVYIYLLVTPTDEKIPTTFTTSIVFCYGKLQVMTYTANGETKTKEIVKGQSIELFEDPVPTEEGYYFDAWFKDSEYKYLANEMDITQASKPLYARFANLPSDYIAYDSNTSSYYVKRGTSDLPTDLIIPAKYDDGTNGKLSVTYIANGESYVDGVFFRKSIVTVSLPCTLIEIGVCAFQETNSLTTIKIPESVTTIGTYAFYRSKITSISIPSKAVLGYSVFSGCDYLVSIDVSQENPHYASIDGVLYNKDRTILMNYPAGKELVDIFKVPSSVIRIESYAFLMAKVKQVILPEGLTYIDANGFNQGLLEKINIPSTVTSLIGNPFGACSNLSTITIDNNPNFVIENNILYDKDKTIAITALGNYSTYTIASTTTKLSYTIFSYKSNLTHLTIPASVTTIAEFLCQVSNNLQSVTFEDTANWKDASGNVVDVSDPTTNATYLKDNPALFKG